MRKAWSSFYWGDYVADTGHLSMAHHGAYLMLMAHYYSTGRPIKDDLGHIKMICRANSKRQTLEAKEVLDEFFVLRDGYFYHETGPDSFLIPRHRSSQTERDGENGIRIRGDRWAEIRNKVYARDDYTCAYCGERGGRLECDHVIPVSRGGSNELTNLVTACFSCNRSKHNRTPEEWLQ